MSKMPENIWADDDHWIDYAPTRSDRLRASGEYVPYTRTDLIQSMIETALAAMTKERDEALHFLDVSIAKSPEPLKALGSYLADLLDEDDWPTADQLLNGAVAALAAERAKTAKLVEKFSALEKAATEVSRRGAETGPQWTKLTIALLSARAALSEVEPRDE